MIYHKHHIIPKHVGGSNDSSNLVSLTISEHAEAHHLLFEQYGRWQDELAWKTLSGQVGKEELQIYLGRKVGLSNKGKSNSKEHCANITKAQTGRPHPHKGGLHTLESKANQSKAQTGVKRGSYKLKQLESPIFINNQ